MHTVHCTMWRYVKFQSNLISQSIINDGDSEVKSSLVSGIYLNLNAYNL